MGKKINMLGKVCGSLTVIDSAPNNKAGDAMWKCQCECGNIIITKGSHLRSGNTTSCGCKRIKKFIENNHTKMIDLTNKKFGLLTALYPNGRNNNKNIVWHCICECGNETDVSSHDLITGNTKSCGCMRNKSYGEKKINDILLDNNINFKREYSPKELYPLRFDFYLLDFNCLIEYDGVQHTVIGKGNFDNEEKFKKTQENDKKKNEWCKENNIILIRIPYTHYNNLNIQDLLPETSTFII